MNRNTPDIAPLSPQEYLRPLLAWKWMIIALVVVATGATYVYYSRQPKVYTAVTDLYIGASLVDQLLGSGSSASQQTDRTIQDQARLVTSRSVARIAAQTLRFRGNPEALLAGVEVSPSSGSDFLTVAASRGRPLAAAQVANGIADAFIASRSTSTRNAATRALVASQRSLRALPRSPATSDTRKALLDRIQQLQVAQQVPNGELQQVNAAVAPTSPSSPHPTRNAAFAFALSLLLGVVAANLLYRSDRRMRTAEDVEEVYDLPILVSVPHVSKTNGNADRVIGDLREPFRALRLNLGLAALERPLRVLLVASGLPGEGKSTVVHNLALTYCEAGLRVAVLDADLRNPSQARLLGMEPEPGLTNVLTGGVTLEGALQPVEIAVSDASSPVPVAASVVAGRTTNGGARGPQAGGVLRLLASGHVAANPSAVLGAQRVKSVLSQLAEQHDVVLIDSTPLLPVSDVLPLLSVVDGILLVARVDQSSAQDARRALALLGRVPEANVLGVVANDVRVSDAVYPAYPAPQ